jgi:hypothetical protein
MGSRQSAAAKAQAAAAGGAKPDEPQQPDDDKNKNNTDPASTTLQKSPSDEGKDPEGSGVNIGATPAEDVHDGGAGAGAGDGQEAGEEKSTSHMNKLQSHIASLMIPSLELNAERVDIKQGRIRRSWTHRTVKSRVPPQGKENKPGTGAATIEASHEAEEKPKQSHSVLQHEIRTHRETNVAFGANLYRYSDAFREIYAQKHGIAIETPVLRKVAIHVQPYNHRLVRSKVIDSK